MKMITITRYAVRDLKTGYVHFATETEDEAKEAAEFIRERDKRDDFTVEIIRTEREAEEWDETDEGGGSEER